MDQGTQYKYKKIWFAGVYYILAVMLYVINMFVQAVRPGVFATVFLFGVAIELIIIKQVNFNLGYVSTLVKMHELFSKG